MEPMKAGYPHTLTFPTGSPGHQLYLKEER